MKVKVSLAFVVNEVKKVEIGGSGQCRESDGSGCCGQCS